MIKPDILDIGDENSEPTEEVVALKRQIECLHDLMRENTILAHVKINKITEQM